MKKLFNKKNIIITILIIDTVIGCLLFRNRLFSHLAIWDIIESDKKEDFYWEPAHAPEYFNFEKNGDGLKVFKKDVLPLFEDEKDEFKIILKVAQFVKGTPQNKAKSCLRIKWDSPEMILKQVKEGAAPNCFYSAILFSEYLSSMGIKSRLWALENEKFEGIAHTVAEVYVEDIKSWVFFDTVFGFYAMDMDTGRPLSFLELRDRLLSGNTKTMIINNVFGDIEEQGVIPNYYVRLTKLVFLRTGNNFIAKYNSRYGILFVFRKYIDKFPDRIRRGVDYFLAKQDIFIHYVDRFSKVLKYHIIAVKLLIYFFIISICAMLFIYLCSSVRLRMRQMF